jgi:hypothetical protein
MAAKGFRRFAHFAPARNDKHRLVRTRVTDMNAGDAAWWDARVQPTIALTAGRADRLWFWTALLPALVLSQFFKGRQCRPLVIWAYAENGRLVRAAMSLLIERYPRLDVASQGFAHYLWFLSSAPTSILAQLGVVDPPSLGRVSVDTSMVLSENDSLSGRIGLHAAPSGGGRLLNFYATDCRLLQLPPDAALPRAVRRANDGRFFYADDALASTLLQEGDVYR